MNRTIAHGEKSFAEFYKELVDFVNSSKPCFSVRDSKKYTSMMKGESIYMVGTDRKSPAIYSKTTLNKVFEIIKSGKNIKTKMLNPAVGRNRSPILALMLASGVLNQS